MKATGTIIRRSALTETSLIVHWCTVEMGLVKTVAKGARRPKSSFAGKIDLFYSGEIEVHVSKKSDLHTLKEVAISNSRLPLRRGYLPTLGAAYFAQLVDQVAEPESPMPEIHDLLERGLNYLEQNDPDLRAVLHFEKQLAECLGIREPGVDPFRSIEEVFGRLPKQREELLGRI
ncbi:MAG: DNA repair protein RecO [Verrucomicrobiota bacterium]